MPNITISVQGDAPADVMTAVRELADLVHFSNGEVAVSEPETGAPTPRAEDIILGSSNPFVALANAEHEETESVVAASEPGAPSRALHGISTKWTRPEHAERHLPERSDMYKEFLRHLAQHPDQQVLAEALRTHLGIGSESRLGLGPSSRYFARRRTSVPYRRGRTVTGQPYYTMPGPVAAAICQAMGW